MLSYFIHIAQQKKILLFLFKMEINIKILLLFTFLFLKSPAAAQPLPRLSSQTERRALLDLRSSLGISAKNWNRKANPCLNWTGIECKNGHLTGINLSGVRRTRIGKLNPGFDIDPLPSFPFLSSFNSSGFSLRGSIPEWLGQKMSNLEVLDLRSSSIFGSIPSSIGGLIRLRVLNLFNNSVTGNMPNSWGKLSSLSVLDLSHNLLTGQIPSEISSLVNLTKLDLSSNFLSGTIPPDFGLLLNLKLLNLCNNSLSSLIPAQLGNLSQLIDLDLGFNSLFGSIPEKLEGLVSLKKMLVGNNELEGSLSDGLFQQLIHLEYLVINRNYFVGEIPDSLWSLSRLNYLDVSGNNLTGILPNLDIVDTLNVTTPAVFNFSSNIFYGNLSVGSGKINHTIDVSNNYFEGLAPNYDAETNISIILSNNCFLIVPDQRNFEACQIFYSDRGIYFVNNEPFEPPLIRPTKSRQRLAYVMVGVFGGLGLILILTAGIILLLKLCNIRSKNHHQRQNNNINNPNVGHVLEAPPKVSIDFAYLGEKFTYQQMLSATSNFSSEYLIKEGHSGDLFRGMLDEAVVVKRVDLRSVKKESLMAELDLFGKAMNNRLVPLVGHCLEDEYEKFLVYKYMVNGDLSNALYRVRNVEEEDLQSLDWITRLKIAIGAAEALSYLHHECNPSVVHRDIQASSILLDDKYEVRLGSLSEVCASSAGNTHQNMMARFLRTPQTSGKRLSGSPPSLPNTCAFDVYCFGKLLLELITGKLGISSRLNDSEAEQWLESNLPFITQYEKEQVINIVDQSLIIDEDLLEEVWAVAIVAKSCLNPKPSRRPSMRHVLKALENPFKVVREESSSSGRLRATSSTRSWAAGFFASWRQNSSEGSNGSGQTSREIIGGLRQTERVGSRGSGVNDYSSSHKRSLSDVFPEPVEVQDVERYDGTS